MKREISQEPMVRWDCDGCDYIIGPPGKVLDDGSTIDCHVTVLRIPTTHEHGAADGEDGFLEFHFHGPAGRSSDCFRYWAHSPHVMARSLERRGWLPDEVQEFLATHLYREAGGSIGLERPKART